MTLSDLEWLLHASHAISAVAELFVVVIIIIINLLLGRIALVRDVGYSHQTFPCTICRSVGRSVQCVVEKR